MKGGLARQRYAERQQRNRIIQELENLYAQKYSVEEVRAMGNKAGQFVARDDYGRPLAARNVTFTDRDTVSTVAAANGVAEIDILNANPQVNTFKPGMVINVPGSEAWRAQNITGGGTGQATAALGAPFGPLSKNQNTQGSKFDLKNQGPAQPVMTFQQRLKQITSQDKFWNPQYRTPDRTAWNDVPMTPRYGTAMPTTPAYLRPRGLGGQEISATPLQLPTMIGANGQPIIQPRGLGGQTLNLQPTAPRTFVQQQQPTTNQPVTPGLPRKTWFAPRGNHVTLLDRITRETSGPGSRLPTEFELKLLINAGRANPPGGGGGGNSSTYGGGGYSYKKFAGGRGGGGGRGNRTQGGGYQQQPRLPAFSNNASFRGLVNWRL